METLQKRRGYHRRCGCAPEVDDYIGRKALALCKAALESGVVNRTVTLEEIEAGERAFMKQRSTLTRRSSVNVIQSRLVSERGIRGWLVFGFEMTALDVVSKRRSVQTNE